MENAPIAIIEDDPSVQRALRRLLTSDGFSVEVFPSAREYLLREKPHPPACLVVDVRLPGMSGIELQEHLSGLGDHPPIVFITAHETLEVKQSALRAGAVDFLFKPFDDKSFLTAVRRAMNRNTWSGAPND